MTQQKYADAIALCQKQASILVRDEQTTIEMNRILGFCKIKIGDKSSGLRLCQEAAALAEKNVPSEVLESRLTLAAAELDSGNAGVASKIALELSPKLEAEGRLSSAWRCWLYAALAASKLHDREGVQSSGTRSQSVLKRLRVSWGEASYRTYAHRQDIHGEVLELAQLGFPSN